MFLALALRTGVIELRRIRERIAGHASAWSQVDVDEVVDSIFDFRWRHDEKAR
jgi:hypothetical protein